VEGAARRAVTLNACTYQSVKSMLQHNLDTLVPETGSVNAPNPPLDHPNLRGAEYFDTGDNPLLQ
jgi:hypothetical protein